MIKLTSTSEGKYVPGQGVYGRLVCSMFAVKAIILIRQTNAIYFYAIVIEQNLYFCSKVFHDRFLIKL